MGNFNDIFGPDRDVAQEITRGDGTDAQAGDIVRISADGTSLEGYQLISGTGVSSEIVTETTVTNNIAYVANSFTEGNGTSSSTIQFTSSGVDLTGVFEAGDVITFSGTFGGANATAFGSANYLFAYPIATIAAPASSVDTNPWTITFNLNVPPFASWTDASTANLVQAVNGGTLPGGYPSSNQTETFFLATDDGANGLDIGLSTTTMVDQVQISTLADGDLEIAGINADGVVTNLTEGDFGTAGQAVLVNSTADGLVFGAAGTNHSALAASTVPLNNAGQTAFVDSVITQSSTENEGTTFNTVIIASGEGEGAAQNSLNVNGTTINTSGAVSGVSLSTQTASVDITNLAGGSSPSALIYRAGIVQPINLGANGQVLAVDTSLNPTSLRWTDLPTAGVGTITEETSTTERDFSVSTPFTGEYQSSFTDVFNAGDTSDFTLEVGGTNQSGNAWSTTNLTLRGNQAAANGFWGTGNVTGGNPNNWNFGDHVALFVSETQYALYTVDSSAGLSNWNLTHVTSMGVIPSAGASVTIGVANSSWPPFASFTQIDDDLTVTGGITGNLALDTLAQTTNNGDGTFNADGTVASTTNYKIEVVPANTTVTTPLANTIYLHLES